MNLRKKIIRSAWLLLVATVGSAFAYILCEAYPFMINLVTGVVIIVLLLYIWFTQLDTISEYTNKFPSKWKKMGIILFIMGFIGWLAIKNFLKIF